jgi:uncharacterized protein
MSEAVVSFLRNPRHYPGRPARVEVIETHFAWIFLTDRHAWKLKKPVARASMNYLTVAARRRSCLNELTLNRRLAPDVYLDVMPVTRSAEHFHLGAQPGARVVDWVVQMRRLPAERMLDCAIERSNVGSEDLRAVATLLTKFFDSAPTRPAARAVYVTRLEQRILRDLHELSAPELGLDSAVVARVVAKQHKFVSRNGDLLGARGACLIDGHGDLRPEHAFLGDRAQSACVIDCLEFDSDLRWLDPAEEVARLAVECRYLGGGRVARELVALYRATSHLAPSRRLLDFYMSLGALNRAKLAAWHLHDPQFAARALHWQVCAGSYLEAADRHARDALSIGRPHGPAIQQRTESHSG